MKPIDIVLGEPQETYDELKTLIHEVDCFSRRYRRIYGIYLGLAATGEIDVNKGEE